MTSVNGKWEQACAGFSGNAASLGLIGKEAEIEHLAVDADLCHPFLVGLFPRDPTEPRGTTTVRGLVLTVASLGDDAEVCAPTVQAVTVDMVNFVRPGGKSQDGAVELDGVLLATAPVCAGSVPAWIKMPLPLACPFGIGGINKGVASDHTAPAAQGDAYGIIGLHSDSPPSVTPPAVTSSAGASAWLNYSTPLEGGRSHGS